jgi:hypothetical protein
MRKKKLSALEEVEIDIAPLRKRLKELKEEFYIEVRKIKQTV